jgi:hypothetical protein
MLRRTYERLAPNCQRESIAVLRDNNHRDSLTERAGAVLTEGRVLAIAGRNAGEDDVFDERLERSRQTRNVSVENEMASRSGSRRSGRLGQLRVEDIIGKNFRNHALIAIRENSDTDATIGQQLHQRTPAVPGPSVPHNALCDSGASGSQGHSVSTCTRRVRSSRIKLGDSSRCPSNSPKRSQFAKLAIEVLRPQAAVARIGVFRTQARVPVHHVGNGGIDGCGEILHRERHIHVQLVGQSSG